MSARAQQHFSDDALSDEEREFHELLDGHLRRGTRPENRIRPWTNEILPPPSAWTLKEA